MKKLIRLIVLQLALAGFVALGNTLAWPRADRLPEWFTVRSEVRPAWGKQTDKFVLRVILKNSSMSEANIWNLSFWTAQYVITDRAGHEHAVAVKLEKGIHVPEVNPGMTIESQSTVAFDVLIPKIDKEQVDADARIRFEVEMRFCIHDFQDQRYGKVHNEFIVPLQVSDPKSLVK